MNDGKPYLLNLDDVPWEPNRAEGWGSDDQILANHMVGERLDTDVTRLLPGEVSCPYHFHHIGEELFIVLEGEGLLRYGGREHRVRPRDVVSCPPGPASAHQFINDTDKPLVYLAISTRDDFEIAEYPDSGKLAAYGKRGTSHVRHMFRVADAVPYMDGERHPISRQAYRDPAI